MVRIASLIAPCRAGGAAAALNTLIVLYNIDGLVAQGFGRDWSHSYRHCPVRTLLLKEADVAFLATYQW